MSLQLNDTALSLQRNICNTSVAQLTSCLQYSPPTPMPRLQISPAHTGSEWSPLMYYDKDVNTLSLKQIIDSFTSCIKKLMADVSVTIQSILYQYPISTPLIPHQYSISNPLIPHKYPINTPSILHQ